MNNILDCLFILAMVVILIAAVLVIHYLITCRVCEDCGLAFHKKIMHSSPDGEVWYCADCLDETPPPPQAIMRLNHQPHGSFTPSSGENTFWSRDGGKTEITGPVRLGDCLYARPYRPGKEKV